MQITSDDIAQAVHEAGTQLRHGGFLKDQLFEAAHIFRSTHPMIDNVAEMPLSRRQLTAEMFRVGMLVGVILSQKDLPKVVLKLLYRGNDE